MKEDIKTVSLLAELDELHNALGAALHIGEQIRNKEHPFEKDHLRVASGLVATLNLVCVRVRDLGRVVRRQMDPADFWAPHNNTDATPDPGEDPDVRFKAWNPRQVKAGRRR
jgi:hypothetical protein